MMTETKIPNIQIVKNTDTLASCGCCGEENYTRGRVGEGKSRRETFTPRPSVRLWDVRVCPNGSQTWVTKLCDDCLEALHGSIGIILSGQQNNVSYTK